MSTLYELQGMFLTLWYMAATEELDEQALADTMESLELELEDKADGYAKVIHDLKQQTECIKKEMERLRRRKQILEKNIEKMTYALQNALEIAEKPKIQTALFTFSICKTPPAVRVLDEQKIPEKFWKQQDPVLDRTGLLKEVKEDPKKYKGIAVLTQNERLRIR